jgi:hypothetical protein
MMMTPQLAENTVLGATKRETNSFNQKLQQNFEYFFPSSESGNGESLGFQDSNFLVLQGWFVKPMASFLHEEKNHALPGNQT